MARYNPMELAGWRDERYGIANARGMIAVDKMGGKVLFLDPATYQTEVVIDGFPRTVTQARALDAMLADEGHTITFVVALEVPEQALIERLLHRAELEGRTDDTREVISERMREYHKLTEAVLEHYRNQGVPITVVDGTGTPDEVFARIHAALTGISSE